MLPLKYLVHNQDLVLSILSRWEHDREQLHLLERYRISANAIYPFKYAGELRFLRFAPLSEKPGENVLAELEWLSYLHTKNYPCLTPVLSKQGNLLEITRAHGEAYSAVAFAGVPGQSLEPAAMTDEMIRGWGQSLGRLHRLSAGFQPTGHRRPSYLQQLQWMDQLLASFSEEETARRELRIVSDWLEALPQDQNSFGLIHYDFETDNVFYDQATGTFHAIDFDDAVYHWFMMDVTASLMSYADDAPPDKFELATSLFLAGYRTEQELSDFWVERMNGFRRYQNLYGYVRILYAAAAPVQNQPEWMEKLRRRLQTLRERRSADFGKLIR